MAKQFYQDKNILIIGGSFGIGEDLCKNLSDLGANLAIMARSEAKLNLLAKSLNKNNSIILPVDIAIHSSLKKSATKLKKQWPRIDIIIFCVGIYEPMNINNFDLKKAKNILDINLGSFFNIIDVFQDHFTSCKVGQLAIISSVAGYFGMPNSLAYGASKAGLSHLTESLLYELKKYHVKVQLINPGFVQTRLTDKNNFKMPGIISSKKASDIIIKKLQGSSFEIAFPIIFVFFMKILKILPTKFKSIIFSKL